MVARPAVGPSLLSQGMGVMGVDYNTNKVLPSASRTPSIATQQTRGAPTTLRRPTAIEEEAALQREIQDRLFPPAKNPAGRGTKRTPKPRGSTVAAKRAALARSGPVSSREQQALLDDIAAAEAAEAFKIH